jgi:hypothetical protein
VTSSPDHSRLPNVKYTILFRAPGGAGNCHRTNADGKTHSPARHYRCLPQHHHGDGDGDFTTTATTPNLGTTTGSAKLCAQDVNADTLEHQVVTGNVLDVNVAAL